MSCNHTKRMTKKTKIKKKRETKIKDINTAKLCIFIGLDKKKQRKKNKQKTKQKETKMGGRKRG